MVLVLKKDADLLRIKSLLADNKHQKKFDAKKFCGALKTEEDGLKVQHQLRNEWK